MDIHERIRIRRAELDLSLEELGAAGGVSWQAAQQWEQPDGTAPKRTRMKHVADALRLTESCLSTGVGWENRAPASKVAQEPATYGMIPQQEEEIKTMEGSRVPVVGEAKLGDSGYFDEYQHPAGQGDGFVLYPTKDPNTYALRCKGDSMRPRIKPGEFVVIEPNHAVHPGDEVMVKCRDGRKMIKILAYKRNGSVELHSINEDHKPITLDMVEIEAMHYVGGILKASRYYPD